MNKYIEKVASLEKRAFEVDFEDDTHYGIASNRAIKTPDIIGALRKAAKSGKFNVTVTDDFGEVPHTDHERFHEILNDMEDNGGWDRRQAWSMSMDKNHPEVVKHVGKLDEWMEPKSVRSVIADHIYRYHS